MPAQQLEVRLAQQAAQAVADGVGFERAHAFAARQRGVPVGGANRFGAEYRNRRVGRLGGDGTARQQAAAAERGDQAVERASRCVEHFQRGGALAGDDARIGVGMDQLGAGLCLHLRTHRLTGGQRRCTAVQHRAVGLDRRQLGRHRLLGDDHMARNPARARSQRQRGAVVAGGMGDHAARGLRPGQ